MKKILISLLLLVAGWQTTKAQDPNQFKVLSDSAYQASGEYQAGNKYQKDAILFMDMVAATHPYYIKPERREEWFAKKPALLERCSTLETDEDFADVLIEVLGPLRDKHTDLTTTTRLSERKNQKTDNQQELGNGAIDREHIMRPHSSFYDYQLFPEQGICYLQFNRCMNASDYPFDKFLTSF